MVELTATPAASVEGVTADAAGLWQWAWTNTVGRPGLDPGTLGLKVPCSTR